MEKTKIQLPQSDDDAACGRFWEIYANEAKDYDEGLVKSWKDDMDVILVFAVEQSGLYSAVLTAFVIESYQTLQEDPADVSAQLLKTISLQLAAPSNAFNISQTSNDPFTPTASALACNILWFISLSLSLICAFLAMFIQQWCRHFMHRITFGRSPTARARLIQFFYFGLKSHRMHIIVDLIPYLLHLSLFYFFGGLSAFLWSINRPLAWLILAVLALLVTLYSIITLLPVFSLSSPYQTPLSSLVWRLRQAVERVFIRWLRPSPGLTDPERGFATPASTSFAIQTPSVSSDASIERSDGGSGEKWPTLLQAMIDCGRIRRLDQESGSIAWTLRSLNDDKDFLNFIEALPGVLEDHQGLRHSNLHLLKPILNTSISHCDVIARAHWLLLSVDNPRHSSKYQERCRNSVSAFFWVLSRLPFAFPDKATATQGSNFGIMRDLRFPKEMILSLRTNPLTSTKRDYSLSIMVLCMLQNCCFLDRALSSSVDSQTLRALIETGDGIFKPYSYQSKRGFLAAGFHLRPEEQLTLANVVSHLFWAYLQVSGIHFPLGFDDVCTIFRHYNIEPKNPSRGPGSGLLASLTFQLDLLDADSRRPTTPSLDEFDSIFKIVLSRGNREDLLEITSYISRRLQLGWWTTSAWQYEELEQLCNILADASQLPSPTYGTATWADACKRIIVYGHQHSKDTSNSVPIRSMLERMIQIPDIESHSSLAFFVKLTIIRNYSHGENDVYRTVQKLVLERLSTDERFKALISDTDPKDLEPYTDSRFGSTINPRRAEICSGERGINGTLLLIQALTTHLSLPKYRQILEIFYYFSFPADSVAFLARNPILLRELVKITEEFCTLSESNPSTDLLDINRMLWHIWRSIVSDGPWKDPNPWRDLNPQSNSTLQRDSSHRDPGPWGDPNPWTNPDFLCLSALRLLPGLATNILSTPPETLNRMKDCVSKRARLYAGIDDFDLVADAASVRNCLVTFSSAFPRAFAPEEPNEIEEVTKELLLSKHIYL